MQLKEATTKIQLGDLAEVQLLFGPHDVFLKTIENSTDAKIVARSGVITITGHQHELEVLESLFDALLKLIDKGIQLTERDIVYAIKLAKEGLIDEILELYDEQIGTTHRGKPIRVKTLGQRHYITSLKKQDIVFGLGPAGTGKTYLAVVMAVNALKDGRVKRIVLTRPAVEAGESLGFLPGDLQEKVDPYLRPLYDSLYDVLGTENVNRFLERGIIEIAPLAYMRGRTLDDSFVILDEAQNTTGEQMKMILTRLGFGSKMVITGDVTQVDLPRGKKSGLKEAEKVLNNINGISFVYLQESDVVRHSLVQKVIRAYEKANPNSEASR